MSLYGYAIIFGTLPTNKYDYFSGTSRKYENFSDVKCNSFVCKINKTNIVSERFDRSESSSE